MCCISRMSRRRGWARRRARTRCVPHRRRAASYATHSHTFPLAHQDWAFESREFLRALVVGKPVTFTSTHSLPPSDDVPRDIGTAEVNGVDLASELLKNGWAKLKELKRDPTEEDLRKRELEAEARAAGKGIWNPHGPKVSCTSSMVPDAPRIRFDEPMD